jgi:5-methylthioadenosine/S-adenosylhomocysteine deaminase
MAIARRTVLQGIAAAGALSALVDTTRAQAPRGPAANDGKRTLIKGGYVVSLDRTIGEIEGGDVLIDGATIAAVGRNLIAPDAEIIDARAKVVLPGLIDTHRHTWETLTRSWISEGDLPVYQKVINGLLGPRFRPEDVYIGNLLGAIGALNSGITGMLDWSHIMNSPAHADAAIKGLADSGMRSVFAYGYSPIAGFDAQPGAEERRVADLKRVHQQYFRSDDQLMTLAVAGRNW